MFGKSKVFIPNVPYDSYTLKPVLKCSVCNGEQIAGFKDKEIGKFTEVCLIKNDKELDAFMETYDLTSVNKEY